VAQTSLAGRPFSSASPSSAATSTTCAS